MQVGDVVRVIDSKNHHSHYHAFDVGTEVTVECIDRNDATLWGCRAINPNGVCFQWVYKDDLEPLETKSGVDQWFDERLAEPKKKERVPDELDWEKHKAFMRSLR